MKKVFFNFCQVPDFLINKKYKKADFEVLKKLLSKVQKNYLKEKASILPDRPLEEMQITDDDEVPLELFDIALGQIKHKFDCKVALYKELISSGKKEVHKMVQSLGLEKDAKKKAKLEPAVFISFLNQRLESNHTQLFNLHYKHELLQRVLVRQFHDYKTTEELQSAFDAVTDTPVIIETVDYRQQLAREMAKFNGKVTEDGLSQSDHTSVTGGAQSAANQQP